MSRIRKRWLLYFVVAATMIIALAVRRYENPPLDPRRVAEGRQLYFALPCSKCHAIHGLGGNAGPDLGESGSSVRSMANYIYAPKYAMPRFGLSPDLSLSIAEFLASQRH